MDTWTQKFSHLIITTIIAALGMAIPLGLAGWGGYRVDVVVVIFFAGMLGAVANNYRRLFLIPRGADAHDLLKEPQATVQFYLSAFIGGLFGLVAYVAFAADILSGGALFPHFVGPSACFKGIATLLHSVHPEKNLDAAKALLWGFIAGFSEKLIPNFLDKAVEEAQAQEKKRKRDG